MEVITGSDTIIENFKATFLTRIFDRESIKPSEKPIEKLITG